MATDYTKENTNIYFRYRKEAAKHNEKLNSCAGAAEYLDMSESNLKNIERGKTKAVPVDRVVDMAELYNAPELKTRYCREECPIGGYLPVSTQAKGIEGVTLRLLRGLNTEDVKEMTDDLIAITADGEITEEERPALQEILSQLGELTVVISELMIASEKALAKI